MPFAVSSKPSIEELSEAVNYLLSNFSQTMAINPNTGRITTASYGVVSYLYKFLQIRYADSFNGEVNFSNSPTDRLYYGIRNDDSGVESTNPADYLWLPVTGGFGTTKFVWYATTGGRQIELFIGVLPPSVNFVQDNGSAIDLDLLTIAAENITTPSVIDYSFEIQALEQAIGSIPQPQLGTMAPLEQENLPWVTFDTTPQSVPPTTGTVAWDGGTTLGIQMTANVLQPVGEAQYFYIKADSTITKGQLIMFTGAVGASGVIKGAPATGLTDGQYLMGIAAENIATNGFGLITSFGHVRGWNTTGAPVGETWADGDVLYYNPSVAGGLTKTQPIAPNVKATIAVVVNAAPAGSGDVFVRVSTGSVLGGTDSNVQFSALAANDLIQYNGTIWSNVTPASVIANVGGAPVIKTANFTVAAGETWLINNKSGSTCVVTMPTASSWIGRSITIKNMQAQLVNSASSNIVPLDSTTAGTAILLNVVGNWATMVSDGTNWVIMQAASNNNLLLE
jgi:hypothetical protein